RSVELRADEAVLVKRLHAIGYDVDSVWDLVNNVPDPILKGRFVGPYKRAYPVLMAHLQLRHDPRIREGIIRALTVRDGGVDLEIALLTEFKRESDPGLRWVLANALRIAMPYSRRRKHPEIAAAYKG